MQKEFYKVYFWATKTKHGKEETRLHAVYMPRRITRAEQIKRGTAALAAEGYYNIKYGSTVATEIIFA